MDPAPETPQGTLLGDFWRFIPRGWKVAGALGILAFAALQVWAFVDGARRARLLGSIQEALAALPPEPDDPESPDADNAAPAYRKAFRAVDRSAMNVWYTVQPGVRWNTPPKEVAAALQANGEALRLLRSALEKPSFAPELSAGAPTYYRAGNLWELLSLSQMEAVVALRGGRTGEAVDAALLPARMARQIGPGRDFPWNIVPEYNLQGSLQVLFEAVAHAGFDEGAARAVLRDLPSQGEERTTFVAAFVRANVRRLGGSFVEYLGGGKHGRGAGWSAPSVARRLKAMLGAGRGLPGMGIVATTGDLEKAWSAAVFHRGIAGRRGGEAARALVAETPGEMNSWGRDPGVQYRYGLRSEFLLEARLDLVRVAAALRLFELRKGRAPASLADLVPEILPAVPQDPFADAPFRYAVRPDGWTLSSAGPPGPWPANNVGELSIAWKRPGAVPQASTR